MEGKEEKYTMIEKNAQYRTIKIKLELKVTSQTLRKILQTNEEKNRYTNIVLK